jgi:hypothetical protein
MINILLYSHHIKVLNHMEKSKHEGKIGSKLIISILREADKPLTTRQLQEKVKKVVSFCVADSVIALNLMRIRGTIRGERAENRKWVWWIDEE